MTLGALESQRSNKDRSTVLAIFFCCSSVGLSPREERARTIPRASAVGGAGGDTRKNKFAQVFGSLFSCERVKRLA